MGEEIGRDLPHLLNPGGFGPHVSYTWVVMVFLISVAFMLNKKMSVVPGRVQSLFEIIFGALLGLATQIMGEKHARQYFPMIAALALFIFFCNVAGLIPGFDSPTNNWNTTAACAIVVFIYYQYIGIKAHGFSYVKHFMGPVLFLAPLIFVIEVISHFARPLSLSMRLFGNIFGEDTALIVLFGLVPALVPLPMMVMAVFTSALQAFVFVILTIIYISGSLEEAH